MQNFKIRGLLSIFIFIALVIGCEKANDIAESAKKAAKKAQTLITEKAVEVSDTAVKVKDNAVMVAGNVKNVAIEQIDEINDRVKAVVIETTQEVIFQLKAWLYEIMKPVFPWLFIIFFLILYVALKFAIPLSNFVQMQLAIAAASYAISFYIFSKIGLSAFAVKGSLWFLLPIIMSFLGFWLFRNKTKIFGSKSKAMSEAVNQAG
jgi:Sec-independent protein translocase protein TatA